MKQHFYSARKNPVKGLLLYRYSMHLMVTGLYSDRYKPITRLCRVQTPLYYVTVVGGCRYRVYCSTARAFDVCTMLDPLSEKLAQIYLEKSATKERAL